MSISGNKLWLASDHHFNHANIIRYSNRPFKDVIEMNEALITNHNAVVKQDDEVWFLGDFSFANEERTERILKRLNGHKHFIYGNHDKVIRKNPEIQRYFQSIKEYEELTINHKGKSYFVVMSHYPFLTWNRAHHNSICLHGHSHGNLNHLNENTRRLDVGVDVHNYYPISFDKIVQIMDKKVYEPIDHHGKKETQEEM